MLKSKMLQTMYFVVSSEGQRVRRFFLVIAASIELNPFPLSFLPGLFSSCIFPRCFPLPVRTSNYEQSMRIRSSAGETTLKFSRFDFLEGLGSCWWAAKGTGAGVTSVPTRAFP